MTNVPSSTSTYANYDAELWESLKSAITASSGYQSWRSEYLSKQPSEQPRATAVSDERLLDEHLVGLYLRDTLETLAY
ncbi:MAG: hypothetical protein WBA76_03685 [Phormidesmis sp.]